MVRLSQKLMHSDEAVCRRGRESQSKPQGDEGADGWVGWDGSSAPASIMVKMLRAVVTPWHWTRSTRFPLQSHRG